MITYQELRKIQAKEREDSDLQELGENFIDELVEYVHAKRKALSEMKDKDSVFSKDSAAEIQQELRNVMGIVSDIYDRRQRKILSQVMISLKTDSLEDKSKMFEFENSMYEKVLALLKSYRSEFFEKIMKGTPKSKPTKVVTKTTETIKKTHEDVILLRIKSDVPSFVWQNGTTYGPFGEGDAVSLPEKVADILVDTDKAEKIEANENEDT